MNTLSGLVRIFLLITVMCLIISPPGQTALSGQSSYKPYPDLNDVRPDLPSPFANSTGHEYVTAVTKDGKYAVIPVTLSNDRDICRQLIVDEIDFPGLAKNGIHSEQELDQIQAITGRSLAEITRLARPNGLSQDGFLAEDETVLSVIKGDNWIVGQLGLTHPQLAKPLFHVLNMMDEDLALDRWNMAKHRWENIIYFFYHDQKVLVEAWDTKGGQKSIFDDKLEGSFHVRLWREFTEDEMRLLKKKYGRLPEDKFDALTERLSVINIGELEPQYIMRYGFYEGHTFWRADPVAISFIFGLKSLEEIEKAFNGKLHKIMSDHFTE